MYQNRVRHPRRANSIRWRSGNVWEARLTGCTAAHVLASFLTMALSTKRILICVILTLACKSRDPAPPSLEALLHIAQVHEAEELFHAATGRYATASKLAEFGLIPRDLAEQPKRGYRLSVSRTEAGYEIYAAPMNWSVDGTRSFFSDQTRQIHQSSENRPARLNDPLVR
jgi:hypothetical protein